MSKAQPFFRAHGSNQAVASTHELKPLGKGVVEAYVSVFGNTFVEGGFFMERKVRIEKGAFASSLAAKKSIPILMAHDWMSPPIGHTTEAVEDDKGLRLTIQMYLDTDDGRSVYRSIEAGALSEYSIGFLWKAYDTEKDEDDNEVRVYTDVELLEASAVLKGANPLTETVSVNADRNTITTPDGKQFTLVVEEQDNASSTKEATPAGPPPSVVVTYRMWAARLGKAGKE